MNEFLGFLMLSVPFVFLFAFMCKEFEVKTAIYIFISVALLFLWVAGACELIDN